MDPRLCFTTTTAPAASGCPMEPRSTTPSAAALWERSPRRSWWPSRQVMFQPFYDDAIVYGDSSSKPFADEPFANEYADDSYAEDSNADEVSDGWLGIDLSPEWADPSPLNSRDEIGDGKFIRDDAYADDASHEPLGEHKAENSVDSSEFEQRLEPLLTAWLEAHWADGAATSGFATTSIYTAAASDLFHLDGEPVYDNHDDNEVIYDVFADEVTAAIDIIHEDSDAAGWICIRPSPKPADLTPRDSRDTFGNNTPVYDVYDDGDDENFGVALTHTSPHLTFTDDSVDESVDTLYGLVRVGEYGGHLTTPPTESMPLSGLCHRRIDGGIDYSAFISEGGDMKMLIPDPAFSTCKEEVTLIDSMDSLACLLSNNVNSTIILRPNYNNFGMPFNCSVQCSSPTISIAATGWLFMATAGLFFDPGPAMVAFYTSQALREPWPPPISMESFLDNAMIRPIAWPNFVLRLVFIISSDIAIRPIPWPNFSLHIVLVGDFTSYVVSSIDRVFIHNEQHQFLPRLLVVINIDYFLWTPPWFYLCGHPIRWTSVVVLMEFLGVQQFIPVIALVVGAFGWIDDASLGSDISFLSIHFAATVLILPSNQCLLWQQQQAALQHINFHSTADKHIILLYCFAHVLSSTIELALKYSTQAIAISWLSMFGILVDTLCSRSTIHLSGLLASISYDYHIRILGSLDQHVLDPEHTSFCAVPAGFPWIFLAFADTNVMVKCINRILLEQLQPRSLNVFAASYLDWQLWSVTLNSARSVIWNDNFVWQPPWQLRLQQNNVGYQGFAGHVADAIDNSCHGSSCNFVLCQEAKRHIVVGASISVFRWTASIICSTSKTSITQTIRIVVLQSGTTLKLLEVHTYDLQGGSYDVKALDGISKSCMSTTKKRILLQGAGDEYYVSEVTVWTSAFGVLYGRQSGVCVAALPDSAPGNIILDWLATLASMQMEVEGHLPPVNDTPEKGFSQIVSSILHSVTVFIANAVLLQAWINEMIDAYTPNLAAVTLKTKLSVTLDNVPIFSLNDGVMDGGHGALMFSHLDKDMTPVRTRVLMVSRFSWDPGGHNIIGLGTSRISRRGECQGPQPVNKSIPGPSPCRQAYKETTPPPGKSSIYQPKTIINYSVILLLSRSSFLLFSGRLDPSSFLPVDCN